VQHKPTKIFPRTSISDEASDVESRKQQPSTFMHRWNCSVVDSIDFQTAQNECDKKDSSDALNCAL
jgi:hypothetical protein